jgi:hypothetical protein
MRRKRRRGIRNEREDGETEDEKWERKVEGERITYGIEKGGIDKKWEREDGRQGREERMERKKG